MIPKKSILKVEMFKRWIIVKHVSVLLYKARIIIIYYYNILFGFNYYYYCDLIFMLYYFLSYYFLLFPILFYQFLHNFNLFWPFYYHYQIFIDFLQFIVCFYRVKFHWKYLTSKCNYYQSVFISVLFSVAVPRVEQFLTNKTQSTVTSSLETQQQREM